MRLWAATVAVVSLCLAMLGVPISPAAAFPSGMLAGVAPGETWYVGQGYNATPTHNGNLKYALDLFAGPGSPAHATDNKPIVAPGTGVVAWNDGNGFCISFDAGDSIKMYHVRGPARNSRVTAGQIIGSVYPAGEALNNGYAHLHLAAYAGAGCPSANGVPFAGSARLKCGPDMTSSGAYNQWSGTQLPSDCGTPPPPDADGDGVPDINDRCPSVSGPAQNQGCPWPLVVIRQGNTIWGKAGLGDAWVRLLDSNGHLQVDGQRIMVLTDNGVLLAKDGLGGVWAQLNTGVDEAAMSSSLVVIRQGNTIWGKAGLGDAWVRLLDSNGHLQVDGQRIMVLTDNGVLLAKDGLGGVWAQLNTGVDEAAMNGWGLLRSPPSPKVPGIPAPPQANAGDSSASLTWTAPSSDGGSPIIGYDVSATPGAATCSTGAAARSCTVSGLTSGISYTFKVRARNAVGASAWSAPSSGVTPTAPAAPAPAAPAPPAPAGGTGTGSNPAASTSTSEGGGSTAVYAPAAVRGATVAFPKRKTAKLNWPAPAGATSYAVRISKKNSTKKYLPWTTVTSPTAAFTKLKKKANYRVQITPIGPGGTGTTTTWKFKQKK